MFCVPISRFELLRECICLTFHKPVRQELYFLTPPGIFLSAFCWTRLEGWTTGVCGAVTWYSAAGSQHIESAIVIPEYRLASSAMGVCVPQADSRCAEAIIILIAMANKQALLWPSHSDPRYRKSLRRHVYHNATSLIIIDGLAPRALFPPPHAVAFHCWLQRRRLGSCLSDFAEQGTR